MKVSDVSHHSHERELHDGPYLSLSEMSRRGQTWCVIGGCQAESSIFGPCVMELELSKPLLSGSTSKAPGSAGAKLLGQACESGPAGVLLGDHRDW
jgi:hypothetical protein